MKKINAILIFLNFVQISYLLPVCIEKENNCEKCNSLTNLCVKCLSDNYFPDKSGGCEPKCSIGKNYCNLCDEDNNLCISCEPGFYGDLIGGCSYTNNCQNSYKGKCISCKEEYLLVEETGFCKSIHTEDLKNCLLISNLNGTCLECKQGFFLNEGDLKCTETEYCFESTYGICNSCIEGYYLDKKNNKCKIVEIENCKQTFDDINCDECDDNFFLADNFQCSETNFCSKAEKGKCIECIDNYFLTKNGMCTFDKNCDTSDKYSGECSVCNIGFYYDLIDKKCKSNNENNEFIYCKKAKISCMECESGFFLGEDLKCSDAQKCAESENGKCVECIDNYFITEDKKCSTIENCKKGTNNPDEEGSCFECIDNFFFDITNHLCQKIENEKYKNCLRGNYFGIICLFCNENNYVNRSEGICYDNTDENDDFYKCASTDAFGRMCEKCIEGYYLGKGDRKCTKVENCKFSSNQKCVECDEGYCLDVKNNICVDNEFLEDVNNKIYIACNRTNEEGTKCEQCLDGYEVGEDGYCIDVQHCEKKEGDICQKCVKEYLNYGEVHYYCYNSIFGCIRNYNRGCLKCEDLTDLYSCNECEKGFELTQYGYCKENY